MKMDLIYDVGMLNGDDTAYYLSRGYSVVGIEANPAMSEYCARRFASEIVADRLTILNVGIAEEEGELPFWICETRPQWSSFHRSEAAQENTPHHQIDVPCRRFGSILAEFGSPFYLKVDIESNDILCLRDLSVSDLPKYVSFEKNECDPFLDGLTVLHNLGYTAFKIIGQEHFLPLEFPPTPDEIALQRTLHLLHSRAVIPRIIRKIAGDRWLYRSIERYRSRPGWTFPDGSSGPFGEDLPGRWQSFREINETFAAAERTRKAGHSSVFWNDRAFWADCHAKRDD